MRHDPKGQVPWLVTHWGLTGTSRGEKADHDFFFLYSILWSIQVLLYCILVPYNCQIKGRLFSNTLPWPCPCMLSGLLCLHFPSYPYSHLVHHSEWSSLPLFLPAVPILLPSCKVLPQWTPNERPNWHQGSGACLATPRRPILLGFYVTFASWKSLCYSSHRRSQLFLTVCPPH